MVELVDRIEEVRELVRTYRVACRCPRCLAGDFCVVSGTTLLSDPPWYPHRCGLCGYEGHIRGKKYPRIVYEVVGSEPAVRSECTANDERESRV